jgi:1,4-dihydroxy-2-naphthoate polyprenyltransferase
MASLKLWVQGARIRTLPLAIAPIALGAAVASTTEDFSLLLSLLALIVSLSLQIGVNYANDYSDGIRGTDANRVGPLRLTGSGSAKPKAVKNAAFLSFGLAGLVGLILVLASGQLWLILVGAASILAAWFYTGGKSPYGYAGLGEVAVFVFFGLVATIGTSFVQQGFVSPLAVILGSASGLYATAVLLVNNIRDIRTDTESGKRTIAVKLGEKTSKRLFLWMIWLPVALNLLLVLLWPATVLGLANLLLLLPATLILLKARTPKDLITVLKLTSLAGFGFGVLVGLGIFMVNLGL